MRTVQVVLLTTLPLWAQNACFTPTSEQPNVEPSMKETQCSAAYVELTALQNTLSTVTQEHTALPEQSVFVQRCTNWSEQTIQCLNLKYQLENMQVCEAAWGDVSENDRKALWKTSNLGVNP